MGTTPPPPPITSTHTLTTYRHYGIGGIRSKRHWIQLGRSCSGYGQCLSTCSRYSSFPIHLSDGINLCLSISSWRQGRQGELISNHNNNNNNTRIWASNRTPPDYWEVVHSRLESKLCLTPYTGLCFVQFWLCLYLIHCICFIYTSEWNFFHYYQTFL